jgi:hypothetical protein
VFDKEKFKTAWQNWKRSVRARQLRKYLRRVLVALIIGVVLYQLFEIGWAEVMRSLPTHPLFYILFVFIYITLPAAEVFIYRQVWTVGRFSSFKAFLTKKFYNDEFIGYSGEFYLFTWARNKLDRDEKDILKNIRDNNIVSAFASNLVAFVLVGLLIFAGIIDLGDLAGNVNLVYVATGLLISIFLGAIIIQFRKYLFSLPLKKTLIIFSIYLTRFIIQHALLIAQWAVVIPGTPLSVWLTFAAMVIVVKRIPFIPSKDLVFLWAGIELSRMLDMATAAVAGMLLVSSVLSKITNLILFLVISYYDKQPAKPGPAPESHGG